MIKDINELIKALEKSGLAGISFDKELLNNKENALKLVVIDDYIIGELPDDLKRDKDVIKSALEANGMAYDYLDEDVSNGTRMIESCYVYTTAYWLGKYYGLIEDEAWCQIEYRQQKSRKILTLSA